MVLELGPITLQSPLGLLWLSLLIPLILFYLIRPKPRMKEIPSLMFFMRASGRNKLLSFFRTFVHDFMLIVQFLIILALALTASQPSINVQHDITASNTVIVIDASASMQTDEGSTRFENAVKAAKGALTTKNSVIVAEERPRLGVQDVASRDAAGFLNLLKPTESGSRIGDAIILAGELLRGKEGRVVVISDFIATEGVDPEIAKAVLKSRGLVVNFINVATDGKRNVGFVDLVVEDDITTAYIKNFNEEEATITLSVADQETQITIPGKGVEPYVFQTIPKIAELEILDNDDLPADNFAWTSSPEQDPVKVSLITNSPSVFLQNALQASPLVELTISQPPVVAKGDFDVHIIHDVDSDEVLAGTYEDILKKVEKGKTSVIVAAQDDSNRINYRGLVPFALTGIEENGFLSIETPTRFTKNIEFGKLPTYFTTSNEPGVFSVAATGNNTGIITVGTVAKGGKLVWYGILEEDSDFKYSPYYPIFWHELIKYVTDQKDIGVMNDRTGRTLLLDRPTLVRTPFKQIETNRIIFDNAGLYRLPDRTIAVNLLNERESDINPKKSIGEAADRVNLKPVREERPYAWEVPLIIAALVILFVELMYVKFRGDV